MIQKSAMTLLTALLLMLAIVCLRPICQAQQQTPPLTEPPQHATSKLPPAAMILECNRVLSILHDGFKHHWRSRSDYLERYSALSDHGRSRKHPSAAQSRVLSLLSTYLRDPQPMDEGPPLGVEVQQAIENFDELRKSLQQQ